ADAGLRQRLSRRRGGAGDLAGRAHRARHARRHRRKARDRRDRAHRHYPDRARIGPARFPGQRALRSDLSPSLSGRRKTVTRGRPMNEERAAAAMRADVPVLAPGHVWLAGAGPGDPGLLTLDALAGLSQADVVVHDALVDRRVLALAGPQARLEFAGKRGGPASGRPSRTTSPTGSSNSRAPESASCGSRAAIRACSGAAARKRWRSRPPACRSASSPASRRGSRGGARPPTPPPRGASTRGTTLPPALAPVTMASIGARSPAPRHRACALL